MNEQELSKSDLTELDKKVESRLDEMRRSIPKATRTLDNLVDDTILNRPIQIRSLPNRHAPLPGTGKFYYDITNKKLKMYTDSVGGWADVLFTTTSTTTSSSTSTSTTTT